MIKKILGTLGILLMFAVPAQAQYAGPATLYVGDGGVGGCCDGNDCDYSSLDAAWDSVSGALSEPVTIYTSEMVDTTKLSGCGAITTAENYLKVTGCESEKTEANMGIYSTDRYRLETAVGTDPILLAASDVSRCDHVILEDIQVRPSETVNWRGTWGAEFSISGTLSADAYHIIDRMIMWGNFTSSGCVSASGGMRNISPNVDKLFIQNSLIYNIENGTNGCRIADFSTSDPVEITIRGVTASGARLGWQYPDDVIFQNVITQDTQLSAWQNDGSGNNAANDWNISDDTTTPGGANDQQSLDLTFVADGTDFHLAETDTEAIDKNTVAALTTDIDEGTTDPRNDIGADEYGVAYGAAGGPTCPGGIFPAWHEAQNPGKTEALRYTCNDLGLQSYLCDSSETILIRHIVINQTATTDINAYSWTLTEALRAWCYYLLSDDTCYNYSEYPAIKAIAESLYGTTFNYTSETPYYYEVVDCDF